MKKINDAVIDYWMQHPEEMKELEQSIASGRAFVFGTETDRIVMAPRARDGILHVVIWLGISVSRDALIRLTPEVQKMTRAIGGRWAEFYTVRKGFIRIASKLGFERMPDEDGVMKFRIPV